MNFYNFCFLLSITTFSFASEQPKASSIKKSLLTLAIEKAEEDGLATWGKENSTPSTTSSSSTAASTPSFSTSNSSKLSASGRTTEYKASPLAQAINRKKAVSDDFLAQQEKAHKDAMREQRKARAMTMQEQEDAHDLAMKQLEVERLFAISGAKNKKQ